MKKIAYILIINILAIGCGNKNTSDDQKFRIEIFPKQKEYTLGDTLEFTISDLLAENRVTSASYQINGKEIVPIDKKYTLKDVKLGKQILEGFITTKNGKTHKIQKEITILSNKAPKIYKYQIINEFAHNKTDYTQGLEFQGDTLIESTGLYGKSSLKKWNVFSGEVYQKIDLNKKYFGEGITIVNDKIIQLTWLENIGFIYDLNLKQIGNFKYQKSKEGWGICYDGKQLYKSDGTEKIWILNPETFQEESFIQLCTNTSIFSNANELEWANGKIYANTYQKDGIMIINPENGAIEGIVDVRGLKEKVEQTADLDVLNGIAYHHKRKTFFVTGKNWSKIFEIVFIPK